MGDRFYLQQKGLRLGQGAKTKKEEKPKRRLKKDIIDEINTELSIDISGLDKCTIDTLDQLLSGIRSKYAD